jgi:hypothetical protein
MRWNSTVAASIASYWPREQSPQLADAHRLDTLHCHRERIWTYKYLSGSGDWSSFSLLHEQTTDRLLVLRQHLYHWHDWLSRRRRQRWWHRSSLQQSMGISRIGRWWTLITSGFYKQTVERTKKPIHLDMRPDKIYDDATSLYPQIIGYTSIIYRRYR